MSAISTIDELVRGSRERAVWVKVGRVFDGADVIRDAYVQFDAKTILYVGARGPAAGEQVLVLEEYTVLPCLIEAHAHLFLDGAPVNSEQREGYLKQSSEWMLARARQRWQKILQFGVGAVRDAGDKLGVGLALAAEGNQFAGKLREVPYIDSPGAAIHHRGRYGAFMGRPVEEYDSPAACVAGRVAEGADRIKLLVSGIINFKEGKVTAPPQMTIEEVKAFVQAAKSHGRQTFAHASGTDGVENSIEGGVNTVEHGFFVTREQLGKMRDRGIAWVPTFAPVQLQIDRAAELKWDEVVVGHLKKIIAGHQEMLRLGQEMGVQILAGSDAGSCGVPHAAGLIDEMVHMERAGMPAAGVLKSATGASADVLGFPEPIGRVAVGYRSRMIFTSHDPLKSVADLRKAKTVIFDGQTHHSIGDENTEGL
ncbi:MAG TPA: amidohydrolase family protein [Tepidisphaeraceae bacterium]|jgi:imidazolonepropionase-like amidohydrolase|nr:amidohydrolase family protein [Tepidisphaeraceae bacterium]